MHLELPNIRLHSLKDFLKHYLMIVLSILTALGLEAWIEHAHHSHAAAEASRRMDEELGQVIGAIERSAAINRKELATLRSLDTMVASALADGADASEINRRIHARRADYQLNANWPTLSTVAWDVAVADQSAGWIDASALQHYSAAYTAERELSTWLQHDSTLVLDAPHLVDTLTDLQAGHPVDPYGFLRSLRQMEMMLDSEVSHLQGAARRIAPALHGTAAGSARAGD
ncbi:hypothetical protein [Fulvimonas yonginensis]|uniref:Chemotaxis methyl-accepting receptor HlyB-like 4HB MCP domain-containing protein n=1 Tax=Fulvimonas yonginensis TaxID=1495200 RepID=A0ABU8J7P0_9GAMM